jgi:3'-phosphoadenosine 5'-phosphosulfate (PAPS) 3'-phosphatase
VVVNEAGGCFTDLSGRRFSYNKPQVRNRGGFVLSPDPVTHRRMIAALAPELNPLNNPS